MKQTILVLFIISIVAGACNYSAGYKKDFGTGLTFSYHGFRVQRVLLAGPGNQVMDKNEVTLNTQVAIVVTGIGNYGLKDGKVFPGMKLEVTDKKGTPVISVADLFAGGDGYPPEQATELRGTITVAQPMAAGETYQVKMHIWDKVTPDNTLDASTTLIVKQ